MLSLGEWHLEVWVEDGVTEAEAERFVDEMSQLLATWASQLRQTPSGLAILRTEVSK